MKILPRSVLSLIDSFQKLPGIGPKTAGRLTFYLLCVPQEQLDEFGNAVLNLKRSTVYCSKCYNVGESDPCGICSDTKRDESTICVVEQPLDIISLEKTGKYKGIYHVLGGAINPLNNIGPDEIRIGELMMRLKKGGTIEVILATNPNMEGEATAMYVSRNIREAGLKIKVTRLAHGLPIGGDLEYADEMTLGKAIEGRSDF